MATDISTSRGNYVVQETPYQVVEAIKNSVGGWIVLTDAERKQFAIKHDEIKTIQSQEPLNR